jgi:Tfp pilus assembly protein PilF
MAQMGGESAFVALQRIARSFDDVLARRGMSEQTRQAIGLQVRRLGAAALPLLGRQLTAGNDEQALWAVELMLELAEDEPLVPRIGELLEAAAVGAASETARMMSIALVAELGGGSVAGGPAAADRTQRASIEELARHLGSPADVARAADHLATSLDPGDLLELVDALCAIEGARAEALVDELLVRDDLHEQVRSLLLRLAAPVRDRRRRRPRPRTAPRACLGEKPGVTSVLVASIRLPGSRPERRRGLCCALADDGSLIDAMYGEEYTPRGVDREIVRPLERSGFQFRELSPRDAAELLAGAAAATHLSGRRLPRAFFLGRDILGLSDEHVSERRRCIARDVAPPLLSRALELMEVGDHRTARELLARHRQVAPDDADGAAALGLCLLAEGRAADAEVQLRRACALAPERAEHHWNRAAALHAIGDRPGCYLALRDYVGAADRTAEPDDRVATALRFVAEYERRARLECPATEPAALARAEQLAARAGRLARAGHPAEAMAALQTAVDTAPEHAPSWTELGVAHARRGETARARRCFERALAARPDHLPARRALAELTRRTGRRTAAATQRPRPKRKRPAHERRGARIRPV